MSCVCQVVNVFGVLSREHSRDFVLSPSAVPCVKYCILLLFERSEFLIPTCGPPVIALYSKQKVCVFVRFNFNLDYVNRKMSAVVADHTKKKRIPPAVPP